MKTLFVAGQLRRQVPGGIGTYTRALLRAMARFDSGPPPLTIHAGRSLSQPDPLLEYGFPLNTSPLPQTALTKAWGLGLFHAPEGFDVVHSTSFDFPPPDAVPLSVTVHDLAWRKVPETFPRRGRIWHEKALQRCLKTASQYITPSESTAGELIAAGADSRKVHVVAEGSDHLPYPDRSATEELLNQLGLRNYLLSVGTLEPRKNLKRVISAFSSAREKLSDGCKLLVVGPKGWGTELAPAEGVVFSGPLSEALLAGVYERARCLVYAPLHEGFGLPAIEAMAAGVPVVASPMPSIGSAALVVDPLSMESIEDGIVTAENDDAVRRELIEAGKRRAGALTWEAAARRHVELWEELAGNGS